MHAIERLQAAARRWADPDEADRQAAAGVVTGFSEAQVAFALNEQMQALAQASLQPCRDLTSQTVRIETDSVEPLAGLAEAVAVVALGARGYLSDGVSSLTRAFLRTAVGEAALDDDPHPVTTTVARAENEAEEASEARRVLPWHMGVAVLDGRENEEAREHLAEDVLLFGGASERCVRIVWAPRGLSPDGYFATFAAFRGHFPAPPGTAARVRMMTAFAAKANLPHAFLDDHSLLITRGEATLQAPGHLRWVEYDALAEVEATCPPGARLYARQGFKGLAAPHLLGTAHRPGPVRFEQTFAEVRELLGG